MALPFIVEIAVVPALLALGLVAWLTARRRRAMEPPENEVHVRMRKLAAADRLKRLENPDLTPEEEPLPGPRTQISAPRSIQQSDLLESTGLSGGGRGEC
jgi:hypothetical protein